MQLELTSEKAVFIVRLLQEVNFKIGQSNEMLMAEGIANSITELLKQSGDIKEVKG